MNKFKRLPNSPVADQINIAEAMLSLCRIRVRNASSYIASERERIERTYNKRATRYRVLLLKLSALGLS